MYEKVGNILKMAKQSNTAAIGFICMDYVMARTVVYAAEATNTPAIIMLFPEHVTIQGTTGFAGYAAMVKELAEQVKVPIGLHCDHDYSYDAIMNTIAGGFGSVMMDGSMHDLDTNIRLTKEVVDKAYELGVLWKARSATLAPPPHPTTTKRICTPSPTQPPSSAGRPVLILWLSPSAMPTVTTRRRPTWI